VGFPQFLPSGEIEQNLCQTVLPVICRVSVKPHRAMDPVVAALFCPSAGAVIFLRGLSNEATRRPPLRNGLAIGSFCVTTPILRFLRLYFCLCAFPSVGLNSTGGVESGLFHSIDSNRNRRITRCRVIGRRNDRVGVVRWDRHLRGHGAVRCREAIPGIVHRFVRESRSALCCCTGWLKNRVYPSFATNTTTNSHQFHSRSRIG